MSGGAGFAGGGGFGGARAPPTKTSFGIILCRVNRVTGRPEVLLVRKRFTYAFADFVHGKYARGRAGQRSGVAALLSRMTTEELLDVWSLRFSQMWYRTWLLGDNRDLYNKKFAKFQAIFMRDDGGADLQRLVRATRTRGALLWEVPKGRRAGPWETDTACAVRELQEETGVEKKDYRILPGVRRTCTFSDGGTRYTLVYFIAIATGDIAAGDIATGDIAGGGLPPAAHYDFCGGEVCEMGWHDIERLRLLGACGGGGRGPAGIPCRPGFPSREDLCSGAMGPPATAPPPRLASAFGLASAPGLASAFGLASWLSGATLGSAVLRCEATLHEALVEDPAAIAVDHGVLPRDLRLGLAMHREESLVLRLELRDQLRSVSPHESLTGVSVGFPKEDNQVLCLECKELFPRGNSGVA